MDSRSLFARQVRAQCETLCELLACAAGHPVPDGMFERCCVSIRMLAGTMQVVDLSDWARLLASVETLLVVHGERRLPWDERIAQLIYELIEKEELLASCHEREGEEGVRRSIPLEEIEAVIAEVEALRDEYARIEVTDVKVEEPVAAEGPAEAPAESPGDMIIDDDTRLARVSAELRAACERVLIVVESKDWQLRNADKATGEDLRRALGTMQFYAQVMERILGTVEEPVAVTRGDLDPLAVALEDFAREIVYGSGRTLTIRVHAGQVAMDPALLPSAYWILHAMAADVFERCNEASIEIDVGVAERHGALHWRLHDNGENFYSDSRLDHEDQLAFYPGLRHVVRTLKETHGTLAVEPGGGREARFEFTLPASTHGESLLVWEQGGRSFAARAAQVVDVLASTADVRREGSYGEHVVVGGRRVPLLKLDVLYSDAPSGGSHIVVLGALERSVAVYVPGTGTHKHGVLLGDSIPVWKGVPHDVVRVDGRRIPLLDADDVMRGYQAITGTFSGEGVSALNGVMGDEFEEDSLVSDELADVVAGDGMDDVEVLVIEQSEATRNALTDILARQRVRTSFAGDVDEALGLINVREPRIIISEFRIPTMAAKKIVDSLREQGRTIPVLVTTSQSGRTADLLVEKLGASGYLSKPLTAAQVVAQLSGFLGAVQ